MLNDMKTKYHSFSAILLVVVIAVLCDECSAFSLNSNPKTSTAATATRNIHSRIRHSSLITALSTVADLADSTADPADADPAASNNHTTLFQLIEGASIPKSNDDEGVSGIGAHDAFRYEWGNWVDEIRIEQLMAAMNTMTNLLDVFPEDERKTAAVGTNHNTQIYDRLLRMMVTSNTTNTTTTTTTNNNSTEEIEHRTTTATAARATRYRIAGDTNWDCLVHVLPKGTDWSGRWPTGSWALVRPITGLLEINLLRGPNREGVYTKGRGTSKQLRGGSDGSLGSSRSSGIGGEECVKYVGGALRSYTGIGGKTMVLEIVVRPPGMGTTGTDGDGFASSNIAQFPRHILSEIIEEENQKNLERQQRKEQRQQETQRRNQLKKKEEQEHYDDTNQSLVSSPSSVIDKQEDTTSNTNTNLGAKLGLSFDKVGGLDDQLNDIVRRVLASRANPELTRRLGINHVRGILLSGPPGCGKTLLARELSTLLGAREPQIVNGPEILDKFVGEAEKNVRALFQPAELEYDAVGDASALHVIILDELDAIARRRGTVSGDSTGVRDSVVNQLLSKMDGIKEANNILVIGLTNRPELLDPALTRPGRLEVQLRVELPDVLGRRDILRIHTRHMKDENGLDLLAQKALEDTVTDAGIPVQTEYFTGAEIAGLVRSAASFAISRVIEADNGDDFDDGTMAMSTVGVQDFQKALNEVRPALGKQDEILESRFPYGISPCSDAMKRLMRDIERFTSTPSFLAEHNLIPTGLFGGANIKDPTQNFRKLPSSSSSSSTLQSLLLVGDGYKGGTGATALACWAASRASSNGQADFVRLVTSLDLLTSAGSSGNDESARATALVERFVEASTMSKALLVFDDIDQICAGSGTGDGYSSLMVSTLRALLRSPTTTIRSTSTDTSSSMDLNSDFMQSSSSQTSTSREKKSLSVIASTSRTDALCTVLHELFDETLVVPVLSKQDSIYKLYLDSIQNYMGPISTYIDNATIIGMAELTMDRLLPQQPLGCKTAIRILERTISMSYQKMITNNSDADMDRSGTTEQDEEDEDEDDTREHEGKRINNYLLDSLTTILDDYVRDNEAAQQIDCRI